MTMTPYLAGAGIGCLLVAAWLAVASLPQAEVPEACTWFLLAGCGLLAGAAANERWRR